MFSKAWPIFLLTAIARVAVFRMYNSLGTSGNPLNFLRESLKPSSLSFPHEGAMAFPRGFLTCDVTPDRSRYEHPTVYLFFFWPRRAACGNLVPRPGTKPGPPAVEARSPNHWNTREFPQLSFIKPD